MSKKADLGAKLEKLALAAVDQANEDGVSLEDRLETLKVAGGFHINATKIKLKISDDDPDAANFSNFRAMISNANGKAAGHG